MDWNCQRPQENGKCLKTVHDTFTVSKDKQRNWIVAVREAIREFKQKGRERRWKWYKAIELITEYNYFTWERNQLATFLSLSLGNRTIKGILLKMWTLEYESKYSSCCLKNEATNFSHSHTFMYNAKMKRMSYKNKKNENGKFREPVAIFVVVQVLAAWSP